MEETVTLWGLLNTVRPKNVSSVCFTHDRSGLEESSTGGYPGPYTLTLNLSPKRH